MSVVCVIHKMFRTREKCMRALIVVGVAFVVVVDVFVVCVMLNAMPM